MSCIYSYTGAHSDYGSLTLLFQKDVGGLEVLSKTNKWEKVEPIPNAIVVNTGDLMQRWTNDEFCSTIHRVAIEPQNSQHARYSIAFFFHPKDEHMVECITTSSSQPKYAPISAGDYLVQKLSATY